MTPLASSLEQISRNNTSESEGRTSNVSDTQDPYTGLLDDLLLRRKLHGLRGGARHLAIWNVVLVGRCTELRRAGV